MIQRQVVWGLKNGEAGYFRLTARGQDREVEQIRRMTGSQDQRIDQVWVTAWMLTM